MTVNDKHGRIWKQAVMLLLSICPEVLKKSMENLQDGQSQA